MKSVRLVAWKKEEGEARREELEGLGFDATFEAADPLVRPWGGIWGLPSGFEVPPATSLWSSLVGRRKKWRV